MMTLHCFCVYNVVPVCVKVFLFVLAGFFSSGFCVYIYAFMNVLQFSVFTMSFLWVSHVYCVVFIYITVFLCVLRCLNVNKRFV